jgi:adenosine deaminase
MTAIPGRARAFNDPALPLIDLHRHINGNVRLTTILDLGQKHRVKLPGTTVDELRKIGALQPENAKGNHPSGGAPPHSKTQA